MAVFPQSTRSKDERVLTYTTVAGPPDPANPQPNCLILPIYGEIASVAHTPHPPGIRRWLSTHRGFYQERWHDGIRRPFGPEPAPAEPTRFGYYILGIATTVESIPRVVHTLSRQSSGSAGYVPALSDRALQLLRNHYIQQPGDTPQFVIGVHAETPTEPEVKAPIAVRYTQFPNYQALMTFPGIQYTGDQQLEKYVPRNHMLMLATHKLTNIFEGALPPEAATWARDRPTELGAIPVRFPLQIIDTRRGHGTIVKPEFAPNLDYLFDIHSVETALRKARAGLANLPLYYSPDKELSNRTYRSSISRRVLAHIGARGLMSYSNQPAKNTDAYRNAGDASAKTLDTSNLGD